MKRRRSDSIMQWLKNLSAIIGLLGSIIVPVYLGINWYNNRIISVYDKDKLVQENVKSIQGLNQNLLILDKKNEEQHQEIHNQMKSINNKIDRILLNQKYAEPKIIFPEQKIEGRS